MQNNTPNKHNDERTQSPITKNYVATSKSGVINNATPTSVNNNQYPCIVNLITPQSNLRIQPRTQCNTRIQSSCRIQSNTRNNGAAISSHMTASASHNATIAANMNASANMLNQNLNNANLNNQILNTNTTSTNLNTNLTIQNLNSTNHNVGRNAALPKSANHNASTYSTGQLIAGKYRLIKKIGSGSFGTVFHGFNISNNREVAIKIEINDTSSSQLIYESKVYNVLSDGKHVPFSKLYNTSDHEKALVIDLLGPSLEEFFAFCDRKFSIKTVCMLADQLITGIEYVHQNSIIHCDIKPDNFLMGLDHNSNRVFIIDFGLSKQYRYGANHIHIKYDNNRSLTGTARYVSINAHVGIIQSRRDDLESIGYVLVYFCVQCLPWQGIDCRGKKQKYDRICEKKLSTPVSTLCRNLPMEFMLYINYCRHLRFDETPDYSFIRSLFRSLLKALDEKYDLCFDWLNPKYLYPLKEYLVNLSSSFFKSMASLRSLEGVHISPLLTFKENPGTDDASITKRRDTYFHSFFSRYPYLDPELISFSIKNYYRCYFIVPPGLMTPVNNILRGLQQSTNVTASNPYNTTTRAGFTAANSYRSNFSRSSFTKK